MQRYLERMLTEQNELRGRIARLKKAVESTPFGVDEKGVELINKQIEPMELYSKILQERIDYEGAK